MTFGWGLRFWDDDAYPLGQGLTCRVPALTGPFHGVASSGQHGVLLPILYRMRQDCWVGYIWGQVTSNLKREVLSWRQSSVALCKNASGVCLPALHSQVRSDSTVPLLCFPATVGVAWFLSRRGQKLVVTPCSLRPWIDQGILRLKIDHITTKTNHPCKRLILKYLLFCSVPILDWLISA